MSKFINKITLISAIACISTVSVATTAILLGGENNFHNENVRNYTCEFLDENDTVVQNNTYVKGTTFTIPELPTKESDLDGTTYIAVGWDSVGLGIPDLYPGSTLSIYTNIKAKPIYAKFGMEDIDPEKLMDLFEILNDLGIDPQDLLSKLGLNMDEFIRAFMKVDFTFNSDILSVPIYFKSKCFGNLNSTGKFKWRDAPYYSTSYSNGYNPSSFASNKMTQLFDTYDIELHYFTSGSTYPVPFYEVNNMTFDSIPEKTRDSVYLTNPDTYFNQETQEDVKYYESQICYPFDLTGFKWYSDELAGKVEELVNLPFLNDDKEVDNDLTNAESKYANYVYENYLTVPSRYTNYFKDFARENDIGNYSDEGYSLLDKVRTTVKSIAEYNQIGYNLGGLFDDPIKMFMEESSCGNGEHFNSVATLLFRTLGLPARYVGGYRYLPIGIDEQGNLDEESITDAATTFVNGGTNKVCQVLKHNWTEVYIKGLGWIEVDCAPFYSEVEEMLPALGTLVGDTKLDKGDVATDINGEGLGPEGFGKDKVFSFNSSYKGTQYFRTGSFALFEDNKWKNNEILNNQIETYLNDNGYGTGLGYNALNLASLAARGIFKPSSFEIQYEASSKFAAAPYYSSNFYIDGVDNKLHDAIDLASYQKVNGRNNYPKATYTSYNFELTEENIDMLKAQKFRANNSIVPDNDNTYYKFASKYRNIAYSLYSSTNVGSYLSKFTELASTLGIGIFDSQFDKIMILRNYFKDNFTFDVSYSMPPDGDLNQIENQTLDPLNQEIITTYTPDRLSYFLDESKTGDSTLFATALTLAYRSIGIPARLVTGYGANCTGKTTGFQNVVTKETAHCWTEVFIDNLGWIMVDATGFEDGRGQNDGMGNENEHNGLYGDGFGGEGVVDSEDNLIEITIDDTSKEEAGYDSSSNKLVKEYDGKPFDLSGISVSSNVVLWPNDKIRLVYDQEDLNSFYIAGRNFIYYSIEIYDSVTNEVHYSSDSDVGINDGRYEFKPGSLFLEDGSFDLEITRKSLEICAPTLSISEEQWRNDFNYQQLDANSETFSHYAYQTPLANGDLLQVTYSGTLNSIGSVETSVSSYKILNSKNEDVTGCYQVSCQKGLLEIK